MSATLLLVQTLNGLQFGIILFLIAAGLTLVFGVMDFINLAHGVQYMVGAYFAAAFVAWTGSFAAGLALALPAALAFGLLLEVVVFRHLYDRDHLDQVLATFGIILFLNQGVKAVWGAAPLFVPIPPALSGSIELMPGLLYPVYRLAIIAAGLAVGGLLYVLVHHTRAGMLVRAGATNAAMVSALGVDIRRLFMVVFGFGAMLAGFAGAMVAPILSVEPGMGDNILILAFVVIVIGGIGSIRGAFLAALLIGLVDTLGRSFASNILRLVLDPSMASQTGRGDRPDADLHPDGGGPVLPADRPLPREAVTGLPAEAAEIAVAPPARPARWRGYILPLVLFALFAVAPAFARHGGEGYILALVLRVMILGIAAMSLDLILGYGALISFGHAAFLGIGAYAVGILMSHGVGDAFVQLAAALAASALFALVTGAISLRTKGVYFIMITLAFGQMLYFLATSLAAYGGDDGMTLPRKSLVLGTRILGEGHTFYYVVLACLVGAYLLCRAIVASRFGRVLRGTRENPVRMQAIGFNPLAYQLAAYVIAGALCGLAGFLLANQTEFVSPAFMTWQRSGELIVMVILGGLGSLHGAIIGAAAFVILEEVLSRITELWKMIFGPMLVLVALFARGGILGFFRGLRRG